MNERWGAAKLRWRRAKEYVLGPDVKWARVRFTEDELSKLMHVVRNGISTDTKEGVMGGQREQRAFVLWPTGSLEHVAMKMLGPWAVRAYVRCRTLQTGSSWICCHPSRTHYTELLRWDNVTRQFEEHDPREPGSPPTPGGDPPGPAGASTASTEAPSSAGTSASDDSSTSVPGSVGTAAEGGGQPLPSVVDTLEAPSSLPRSREPVSAEEAELVTMMEEQVVLVEAGALIVGKDDSAATKSAVGVLVAPSYKPPILFSSVPGNLLLAKKCRIDEKQRPYEEVKDDKRRRGELVRAAIGDHAHSIWSRRAVEDWLASNPDVRDLVSKKWSHARADGSLLALYSKAFPSFQFSMSIKNEPMEPGKPPRLLIADGDSGQLMALATVKAFEDLLFHAQEQRSTKHADRDGAMARLLSNLDIRGGRAVEGDGSAWDTTCSPEIRAELENPVLRHIAETMVAKATCPPTWHEEHLEACSKKTLKLFFKKRNEELRLEIGAIRRSGHRGTSCLNWWVNFAMWTSSIFKRPQLFLNPRRRKAEDVLGKERRWAGSFEGDDSLCVLQPPMEQGDALSKRFEECWQKAGFNMKIVYVTNRATFCGSHIEAVDGRLGSFWAPELPRSLRTAGISTSTALLSAVQRGDVNEAKSLAASAMVARAYGFAGKYPTVSRKYLQYAMALGPRTLCRETLMRIQGNDEEADLGGVIDEIVRRNGEVTPTEEATRLGAMGFEASEREMVQFASYQWSWETLTDYLGFGESLPESWK